MEILFQEIIDLIFSLSITPVSTSQNEKDTDTGVVVNENVR